MVVSRFLLLFMLCGLFAWAQPAYVFSDRGAEKLDKGDVAGALSDFNAALQADPNHAISLARRGFANALNGRKDLAETDWNKALQINPNLFDVFSFRSDFYLKNGNQDAALKDLNRLIELNPGERLAYEKRVPLLLQSGKKVEALRDIEKAISLGSTSEVLLLARASAKSSSDPVAALKDVEAVLKKNASSSDALFIRASILATQGKFTQALKDLDECLLKGGSRDSVAFRRIRIHESSGNNQLAISELNFLLDERKVKSNDLLAKRSAILLQNKNFSAAIKDINKLILADKTQAEWLYQRGVIYLAQGKSKEPMAISDFKKVLDMNPKHAGAACSLAALYVNSGKWDLGLECCTKAIEVSGKAATNDLYYLRSKCYFKKDNIKACCKDLETAAQLGNREAVKDLSVMCSGKN